MKVLNLLHVASTLFSDRIVLLKWKFVEGRLIAAYVPGFEDEMEKFQMEKATNEEKNA